MSSRTTPRNNEKVGQVTNLVITHIFSVLQILFLALKGLWILAGGEALRVTTGISTNIIAPRKGAGPKLILQIMHGPASLPGRKPNNDAVPVVPPPANIHRAFSAELKRCG